jgi:hypothetical protein
VDGATVDGELVLAVVDTDVDVDVVLADAAGTSAGVHASPTAAATPASSRIPRIIDLCFTVVPPFPRYGALSARSELWRHGEVKYLTWFRNRLRSMAARRW